MIDIHTHILPELDDGSSSVEESRKMLGILSEQGVDTVVATPHFYIEDTGIEKFLESRKIAVNKILDNISHEKRPQLALGAEVQFYPEISSMEGLEKLCFSGTKYLLVEMPFAKWTGYIYDALKKINMVRGIVPVVAHVERYLEFQDGSAMDVLSKLHEADALIQINSSFLTSRTDRRTAILLIKKGLVNFMGSDCHNLTTRAPEIAGGYEAIQKKLGDSGLLPFGYWEEKLKEKLLVY